MTTDYTPADSLAYLADASLLDVAIEDLELLDDDSPSVQVTTALEVIRTVKKIIAFEAATHNATRLAQYSNGTPVAVTYYDDEAVEMTSTMHPSGSLSHPALNHCTNHA